MKEYLAKKLSVKKIVFFLLFLLTPVLLSLYQLLPTLELFKFSSRGAYSLSQIQHLLNPWWYTITTVVPDFFGNPASRNNWIDRTYIEGVSYFGVIPLFLALGALLNGKKPKEIIIFGVVFVVSYLLSVDVFITRYIYLLPIPVLTTTVPTRILSLFVFSGSILSAFGLQFMLKEKLSKTWLVVILFLGGVLGICWGIAILTPELLHGINNIDSASVVKRNLFLPTTAWVLMTGYTLIKLGANSSHYIIRMISRAQKIYRYKIDSTFLMLFFTLFELFYFFHKITPFSPAEYIYPKTPVISYLQKNAGINRFWGYGSGYIESNFQTYDKTFSPEGNDPLHILSYTELVSSTGNGSVPAILPRPDAKIQPGFAKEDLGNNIYRKKVLDILGIKYLLEKNEAISDNTTKQSDFDTFPESEYSIVWQDTPWQVYENKNAVTRAIVTSDFVVISDKKNLLQKIYNVSFDPKKTILLSEDPGIMQSDNVGTVQINSYSPNKVVMHTKSSADSLLFLSDTYYPSWHVTVDGKEAKVLKADYAFRANAVPKGEHEVIYYYDDKKFLYGFYLSLLTLMILSVGLWKGKIQSI